MLTVGREMLLNFKLGTTWKINGVSVEVVNVTAGRAEVELNWPPGMNVNIDRAAREILIAPAFPNAKIEAAKEVSPSSSDEDPHAKVPS